MADWVVFEGGDVLDPVAGQVTRNDLLVKDDRIYSIGENLDLSTLVPRGDEVTRVDGRDKTLMPGLIDAHCHMTYGESRAQEEQDLYTSVETRTLVAAANIGKVLRSGVTSISQPGGSYYIGVGLRDAIRSGLIEGPRMTTAGRYLTTSNGLTDWYPTSVGVPEGSIGILTNTAAEMMTEVRKQVKNGVDLIKLADSPYGEYQAFTNDELKIVSDLAHQLKRRVTIHARGSAEVSAAVDAGIDWIMHGNVMTDECIAKLAASKIPLVPTLLLLANMADWGHLVGIPVRSRDNLKHVLERTADTLHRAHDAGVRFLMGTDSGFGVTPYGEWHAREIELLMVYAGLSAAEAIRGATCDAAIVMGLPGEVGVMQSGALADLLLVNGNPLENVRILQDKSNFTVFKGGKQVGPDPHGRRWSHERSKVMSTGELTYETVVHEMHGDEAGYVGGGKHLKQPLVSHGDDKDLLHDLRLAEADARALQE